MPVTRLRDLGLDLDVTAAGAALQSHLAGVLGYTVRPASPDAP